MEVVIDRFEGEYAVVEIDKDKFENLPRILVPDAKEGDVVKIIIDHDSAKKRKEHISNLMDNLFLD